MKNRFLGAAALAFTTCATPAYSLNHSAAQPQMDVTPSLSTEERADNAYVSFEHGRFKGVYADTVRMCYPDKTQMVAFIKTEIMLSPVPQQNVLGNQLNIGPKQLSNKGRWNVRYEAMNFVREWMSSPFVQVDMRAGKSTDAISDTLKVFSHVASLRYDNAIRVSLSAPLTLMAASDNCTVPQHITPAISAQNTMIAPKNP